MNSIKALIHLNNKVKIKVYYLPSHPFGEVVLNHLRQNYPDFEWIQIKTDELVENKTVLIESNARTSHPHAAFKNCNILAINPIWKKNSPEPAWIHIPILRKSFLKRLARFRTSGLIDSYFYPHPAPKIKIILSEILKKPEAWYTLLKKIAIPAPIGPDNHVYLLTNTTDPLRDVIEQNSLINYRQTWEWENLAHSVLAMSSSQRLNLKQILQQVTQDKGL